MQLLFSVSCRCCRQSGQLRQWLLVVLAVILVAIPIAEGTPPSASRLVERKRLPLRAEGRWIVDRLGERVKWSCANWYGPESSSFAFGGLQKRPIDEIVNRIVELGFNCVRVPYSLEAHVRNPVVEEKFLAANQASQGGGTAVVDVLHQQIPKGSRFLQVFDAGIKALTDAGLMVIIDQHVSRAGYCCHWSQDEGFWYVPGYPEEIWIDSLVNMTRRYRSNPLVVAIDLRNEVHDLHGADSRHMTWGDGNPKTDWALAATKAGNRVLQENKDLLIVVMALCFGMELRPLRAHPVTLQYPNRVVYQTHNYIEYQFWNLIQRDFITFNSLRLITVGLSLLMCLMLWPLLRYWRLKGMPRPPLGLLLMSAGSWIFVFGLLFALVAHVIFRAACTYCTWGAEIDFLPWVYAWLVVAFAGALVAIFGWFRAGRPASEGDLLEVDGYASASDAGSDAEGYSDELQNLQTTGHGLSAAKIRGAKRRWDRSLFVRLQGFLLCSILLLLFTSLFILINIVDTYAWNERWLDHMWGFALEEGQPFTAPVWMGEFGYLNHGSYWLTFMRYLASRDVDFAYWAINGEKWMEGFNGADGVYHSFPGGAKFVVELFGILGPDWQTVKKAWVMRDLQALMESPVRWMPTDIGCLTDFLGHFCDVPFRGPEATDIKSTET
eukprot:TRINITY_DN10893_c3_g1_i1.p1 TRINITY_DN10893_c3_g1~~TRINITY_DN10893_c3_g1_i1.p1  ORF type:complete len:664 (+),score=54.61 TRINITY_DN10893_c3_g1_i1:62-2053(+)